MILCDGVFQMAGVAEVPEAGEETEIIRKLCYQVIVASFPTFPLFYKIQFLETFPLKLNFQLKYPHFPLLVTSASFTLWCWIST